MEIDWKGNSWIRGNDTLRMNSSYSRDALEKDSYKFMYKMLKVSERSERALMKTSILAVKPAKRLQTDTYSLY